MREGAFALLAFLGEDMTLESVLAFYFSCAGYFESFFGAGVCFYFWHIAMIESIEY